MQARERRLVSSIKLELEAIKNFPSLFKFVAAESILSLNSLPRVLFSSEPKSSAIVFA
jgi:hypothetical protein